MGSRRFPDSNSLPGFFVRGRIRAMRLAFSLTMWVAFLAISLWLCFSSGFSWNGLAVAVFNTAVAILCIRWTVEANRNAANRCDGVARKLDGSDSPRGGQ
jgi:hypothetical protein